MTSLRQAIVSGVLTRLLDPDTVLKNKIVDFVQSGDFGLASGARPDGGYDHLWFHEALSPDEVIFEARRVSAEEVKGRSTEWRFCTAQPPIVPTGDVLTQVDTPISTPEFCSQRAPNVEETGDAVTSVENQTIRLRGSMPAETWNRLGTKLIPKLRSGDGLRISVSISVEVSKSQAGSLKSELAQVLEDLGACR